MPYLPHWPIPSSLGNRKIDFETVFERMSIILNELENPHLKMPPIIHVSGTNGKGSSAAFLKAIFENSGYKTHIYTSPHLHQVNERIVLGGEKISDNFLYENMEEARLASDKFPEIALSFMEGFTIGAFLAFSKVKADILIMECGMGGRIDATNIVPNKIATLITPISYDHMEYLGNNIERIALEKAMIIRPNTPLIVSAQSQKVKNIIKILANDQKIEHFYYDENFGIIKSEDEKTFDFGFENKGEIYNIQTPNLEGDHQLINFSCAIALCQLLKNQFNKISEISIKKASQKTLWPSRLEKVTNGLVKILKNTKSEIYIDGAHNISGAFALKKWLEIKEDNKKNYIICGFSRDKCKKEFLMQFKDLAKIIAIRVDGEPYPESCEKIFEIAKEANLEAAKSADLLDAIHLISKENEAENGGENKAVRILICGSLHLARDVKKFGKN